MSKFGYISLLFLLLSLAWFFIAKEHFNFGWWLLALFFYSIILFIGSVRMRWNFYLTSQNKIISNIENKKYVVLSFDDGPCQNTIKILDILHEASVPAVFFLIGNNIKSNEAIVKRIISEGHQVGNHSYFHRANFDLQSVKKMTEELLACNDSIEKVTLQKTVFFRPPYGVTNPNLAKAVKNTGLKSIGWNVRSFDTIAKNEDRLIASILSKIKHESIILLHDRCDITVRILPTLIQKLKQRDYHFVTL